MSEQTIIETPAGNYTLKIVVDEYSEQPYNEGLILVTNGDSYYGYDRRINVEHGDDPLIATVRKALANSYHQYEHVSGEALVRWLSLHGKHGVTVVDDNYRPADASRDRNDRVYGVAWAPDDATDPDAYTRAALKEWHAWQQGEVFGWVLTDASGELVESVCGYYGYEQCDDMESEATYIALHDAEQRVAAANTVGAGFVGII